MNDDLARRRAAQLKGKTVAGWIIGEYIDSGKTAFVCEATNGKDLCAIKVFETDFLGDREIDDLRIRLDRQLALVSQRHPNLIRIYDAGYCSNSDCYYLAMQLIKASSLSKLLEEIPGSQIGPLISQIASAAEFLESIGMAHRDIKPDNIVITPDYQKAILLDLGVIRPFGHSEVTDSTQSLRFVGTLRYSSPEFLQRTEDDTIEGWRAVTFYQLGAVLHDLIMKKPIFYEYETPYARLVHAILYETPILYGNGVDTELVVLARMCLLKRPSLRLKMVQWADFRFPRVGGGETLEEIKKRIGRRNELAVAGGSGEELGEQSRQKDQLKYDLRSLMDRCIRTTCVGNASFPRLALEFVDKDQDFDLLAYITFPASSKHLLTSDLTIVITTKILDIGSNLIEFQCVGSLLPVDVTQAKQRLAVFCEGFMDEDYVLKSVEEMMYTVLDQAQQKCEIPVSLRGVDSRDGHWLVYRLSKGR